MKRIVLIDDEKIFCDIVKKNLEKSGDFEVTACYDGETGFKAIKEQQPDLVLLDIMMPGKSGIDVATDIRNDKTTKSIPFAFLSGIIKQDVIEKNKHIIGEAHYISKPVKTEELVEEITAILTETQKKPDEEIKGKVRIVTLLTRGQVDFLDKLGKDVLFAKGHKLSRSQILYEMVDLLRRLNLNIDEIDLNEGLAKAILKRLRK